MGRVYVAGSINTDVVATGSRFAARSATPISQRRFA